MRQWIAVVAAAGIVALDTMVDRLAEDHANNRSHYAIVITSGGVDKHRILYANRRFCEMTG